MRKIIAASVAVLLIGGLIALRHQAQQTRVRGAPAFLPGPGAPVSAGGVAATLPNPPTTEELRPLLDALCEDDPEAALIGMLSWPLREGGGGEVLKDMGGPRAAEAMRQIIAQMDAGEWTEPLPSRENAALWAWVLEELNPLPPLEQLAVITRELEKMEAIPVPSPYQQRTARLLLRRVVDLALPESLPLLRKLVEEDIKLSHRPISPHHWLDEWLVVNALDRIDDPSAIDLLEGLTWPSVINDLPPHWSAIWWRWKFRGLTQDGAVAMLVRCMLTGEPRVGSRLAGVGARLIGPACVPAVGALLVERVGGSPRCPGAAVVLGVLGHPDGIPFIRQVGEDTSLSGPTRDGALFGLELFNNPAGMQALLDIVEACSQRGDRYGVRGALHHIACIPGGRSHIQVLSTHPSSLIRDAAATSLQEDYPMGVQRPVLDQHTAWPPALEARMSAVRLKQQGQPFDPGTIASLRDQLKDPDPYNRYDAIWVLGWIGDYDSLPALTACAKGEQDPKNMQLLLETLCGLYLLRNLPK